MIGTLKLWIEKNQKIANILRFFYRKTIVRYKHYKQNRRFLKNASVVLSDISHIFKELNIQYWLEFGTLLGAIREKDLIKHDLDIDLGLFLKDYSEEIEEVFKKYGFIKVSQISIDNGVYGLEESYESKGVIVDLFYFTIKENIMYSHGFINEEGKSWYKTIIENGGLVVEEITFQYTGFIEIIFLKQKHPIPKDAEAHLKMHYGKNYMQPDPQWKPISTTGNSKILIDKIGIFKTYT